MISRAAIRLHRFMKDNKDALERSAQGRLQGGEILVELFRAGDIARASSSPFYPSFFTAVAICARVVLASPKTIMVFG